MLCYAAGERRQGKGRRREWSEGRHGVAGKGEHDVARPVRAPPARQHRTPTAIRHVGFARSAMARARRVGGRRRRPGRLGWWAE